MLIRVGKAPPGMWLSGAFRFKETFQVLETWKVFLSA